MKINKADFDYYYQYISALSDERFVAPDYWEIPRDSWFCYLYGGGAKVVYIKHGKKASQSKIENNNTATLSQRDKDLRLSQSVSRTKSTIFELAMCNEFTHFCTFTQDKNKVADRYDLPTFQKTISRYIRNQNRGRESKIEYLLIPEQHKNGAWHMHGLIKGLTDADLREFTLNDRLPNKIRAALKEGKKIYNWEKIAKKFGYFTASPIESHIACGKYITKYITKEIVKNNLKSGAHSYFASQGLKRRELIYKGDFKKCPITDWDFENDYVKVVFYDDIKDFGKAKSAKADTEKI